MKLARAALLALAPAALSQTLLVPVHETRQVGAAAYEGDYATSTQIVEEQIRANGFGHFNESVSPSLSVPPGWASAYAGMNSQILSDGLTFTGSASGNGSSNGVDVRGGAGSTGAVTFNLTYPCAYQFHGTVSSNAWAYAWAHLRDRATTPAIWRFDTLFIPSVTFNESGQLAAGTYGVEVYASGGYSGQIGFGSSNYSADLDLTPLAGTNCTSLPNSSGSTATLHARGTTSLTANDLALRATGGPPHALSMFLFARAGAASPLGDGNLCLASPFVRLGGVGQSNANGARILPLDLHAPPLDSAFGGVQAGATWYFQWIFRDSAPAGVNLSDVLWVTFTP